MTNLNNPELEIASKKPITRKQFLSTLGVAVVGLIIPSVLSVSKKNSGADTAYGNSSYGGKS